MSTSIAFGTVPGSTVQCGSLLAVGADAEGEVLWRRGEAAGLVGAEAVLAGQDHGEVQPDDGVPSVAFGTLKVR